MPNYDPITGLGACGERVETDGSPWGEGTVWLPASMIADESFGASMPTARYRQLRYRYDFEYWAARCSHIKDKVSRRIVPFVLNCPQRKLLAVMERQRTGGKPVRVIVVKARQWGGSTLIGQYMAWWQLVLFENCHAVICAHVKDCATTLGATYDTILDHYPPAARNEPIS